MCTQRLYLLLFVWFLIHLLLITPNQCKKHRPILDQYYILRQNRSAAHNYPSSQNEKSKSFKLQKVDLSKPNIDSTSDWYPNSQVKLSSSFINESINSITFPIIDENKNIEEIMKTFAYLETSTAKFISVKNLHSDHPKFYVNSSQSEIENIKTLIIDRPKIQKEESNENSKILIRVKRSANNDFFMNNTSEKKTLLNIDGPNILEDMESVTNQDNSVHIRVKRDNPNKDNVVPRFKSNYLEDLAASFPKSEHELEEERLAPNKIEDERLFKRSSDHTNDDNIDNPSDIELNENFKRKNDEENLRYQQENLDSDLEDQALTYRKKRNNYGKGYDYQKKSFGEDASYEYSNDNNQNDLQIPYRDDSQPIDSMLLRLNYVVDNGDYSEKIDQQNSQNFASKTKPNVDSNNLYSPEILQPEQQNEANLNNNRASSLEEASIQFPTLRDKRRMTPLKKHNKRKFKKKKSKKFKKKPKKKKGKKHRKNLSKLSKMQESLAHLDKVVGDIQVESKVEKMDSSDGRSEVDIAKRDISKIIKSESGESRNLRMPGVKNLKTNAEENNENEKKLLTGRSKRDAQKQNKSSASAKNVYKSLNKIQPSVNSQRFRRNRNEDGRCIRVTDHNQELKYYENIHEPESLNQNDASKSKLDLKRRALTEGAMKSVEEIKTLVNKLVTKVNDLQTIIGINTNRREEKEIERKKQLNPKPSSKNSKRCMLLDKHGNNTSKFTTKFNINTEKPQVLRYNRDQKQKQFLERKKKADSNHSIPLKANEIRREIRERKKDRRKRKSHRKWDRWTDWSSCSVTCGKGRQIRWRHCIRDCRVAETEMEEKTCQLPACPPGKFLGIF